MRINTRKAVDAVTPRLRGLVCLKEIAFIEGRPLPFMIRLFSFSSINVWFEVDGLACKLILKLFLALSDMNEGKLCFDC